jgi:NAD(P)-dependent dehydrogenase (short-subunit alcohol dehydrogenase family)
LAGLDLIRKSIISAISVAKRLSRWVLVLTERHVVPEGALATVKAAVARFGRIDVLVNNAASFYAGYFEELTPEQMNRQLTTSLIGPMNVTRAVLPVMYGLAIDQK